MGHLIVTCIEVSNRQGTSELGALLKDIVPDAPVAAAVDDTDAAAWVSSARVRRAPLRSVTKMFFNYMFRLFSIVSRFFDASMAGFKETKHNRKQYGMTAKRSSAKRCADTVSAKHGDGLEC